MFKEKICVICKSNLEPPVNARKVKNGYVCKDCFVKYPGLNKVAFRYFKFKSLESEDILDYAIPNRKRFKELGFLITSSVNDIMFLDDDKQMILFNTNESQKALTPVFFPFKDVYDVNLVENDQTVSSGGLGAAVVGGILSGGVGAIVGSNVGKKKSKATCSSLSIKVYLDNPITHFIEIPLIISHKKPLLKSSKEYLSAINKANLIESKLKYIIRKNEVIDK